MDTKFDVTLRYDVHLLKYVKVDTHSKTVHTGWLKDIDPLTGNLVLVNFNDNGSRNESVILIKGHSYKSVEVVREDELMKNAIQHFFDEEAAERLTTPASDIIKRKKRLLSWLERNRLETKESDDNIIVCNSVTIHPPYTSEDCVSSNGRVLVMTRNLISSMPETSEENLDSD
ncbi:gem-associated protein 6-like [Argiope bruennichi]|uniref:gem-associated protein 6-like n=1 Tax=Argiope bruennichi TaxID=94029 RepID=UPI0024945B60|nr:gem-associated protein 6-like [Argiope bruennichi]